MMGGQGEGGRSKNGGGGGNLFQSKNWEGE